MMDRRRGHFVSMLWCASFLYIWFSVSWYLINVEREQAEKGTPHDDED